MGPLLEEAADAAFASDRAPIEAQLGGRWRLCGIGAALGLLAPPPWPLVPAWALARTPEEQLTTRVFREATPGVVSVARKLKPGERRRRGSAEDGGVPPTIGSGFLWDAEHVVTNNHVVKEVEKGNLQLIFLSVDRQGGGPPLREVLEGELVGADPATDTAVLRVLRPEGKAPLVEVRPLVRGHSSQLEVGQTVYAIGNPFGLEHSMSRGIISGISRTLELGDRPIRGCIQTDASINPGNSGGPLLDSQGRVIGMNTAILTSSGTSAGVGLAIPVDTVARNVEAILKQGFVRRAFLGIVFAPDEVAEQLQLPGIIVMNVVPGSPAQAGGVKPMRKGALGDVVTALDGEVVRTGADLFRLLDRHAPGDSVSFQVQRAKRGVDDEVEELTLNVTLGADKP